MSNERLGDYAAPAIHRYRVQELTRAQERLRQAEILARSAAALLADLGFDHGLDLKAEIKIITDARKSCQAAAVRIDAQLEGMPVP